MVMVTYIITTMCPTAYNFLVLLAIVSVSFTPTGFSPGVMDCRHQVTEIIMFEYPYIPQTTLHGQPLPRLPTAPTQSTP